VADIQAQWGASSALTTARPLAAEELGDLRAGGRAAADTTAGCLVQRVVHRRDLDAAVGTL
jgi:hypothetical protein